jgi:hypothetical protein
MSRRFGKSGSVYLMLDVPAVPRQGPLVAGVLLGMAGLPHADLTAIDGQLFPVAPVLDRVFRSADALTVVYWTATRDREGVAASHVEVLDDSGEVVVRGDVPLTSAEAPARVELPLAGVPRGSYRLRVTAASAGGTATREVGFAVR